jgi:hypothetical protein
VARLTASSPGHSDHVAGITRTKCPANRLDHFAGLVRCRRNMWCRDATVHGCGMYRLAEWQFYQIQMNGRGGEIRTPDPLFPKQMRYQAALRPDGCLIPRAGALGKP